MGDGQTNPISTNKKITNDPIDHNYCELELDHDETTWLLIVSR